MFIIYDFFFNWQTAKNHLFSTNKSFFFQSEKNSWKKLVKQIGEIIWWIRYKMIWKSTLGLWHYITQPPEDAWTVLNYLWNLPQISGRTMIFFLHILIFIPWTYRHTYFFENIWKWKWHLCSYLKCYSPNPCHSEPHFVWTSWY